MSKIAEGEVASKAKALPLRLSIIGPLAAPLLLKIGQLASGGPQLKIASSAGRRMSRQHLIQP